MRSGSRLERVLRSGRFAVTAELNPPDSADPQAVYDRALVLASVCDAINATDASGANVHMSSVSVCALLTRAGYEPVMQVSCRDKNRIAIQGDLLGAAAMGVRNVLCLTGDGVQAGDQPEAKKTEEEQTGRNGHGYNTQVARAMPSTRPSIQPLSANTQPCGRKRVSGWASSIVLAWDMPWLSGRMPLSTRTASCQKLSSIQEPMRITILISMC